MTPVERPVAPRVPAPARAAFAALLVAGLLATRLAERSWASVVAYTPPYTLADAEPATPPRISERVVLVLVDGLRLDASRDMPFLNRLRERGADFSSSAGAPSYSRPGRASLGTGAWAELHGATTNFHARPLGLDNLFRRAAAAGRSCAVAGSLWGSLFEPDLKRAGCLLREPPVKDEPGRYFELEPRLRTFGDEALAFVASSSAELGIVDFITSDYAAHEFGGRSEQYHRAVARSDAQLEALVAQLDLATSTVVVSADHGHLDGGGHGGPEPEVLLTPLVLVGRGVRAGVSSKALQVDVAPTIAALLGLPIPGASQGRVLFEALDLDARTRVELLSAQWYQQRALSASLLAFWGHAHEARGGAGFTPAQPRGEPEGVRPSTPSLDETSAGAGSTPAPPRDEAALVASLASLETGLASARAQRREAERQGRLPATLAVLLLPLPFAVRALRRATWARLCAVLLSVLAYGLAFAVLVWGRGVRLTLSAINHEQDVGPYFLRLALLSVLAFLFALGAAAVAARQGRRELAGLTLSQGTVLVYLLAFAVALVHWRQGLFMEWQRADLGPGFLAYVNLVQIQAVCATAVLACLPAWFVGRRSVALDS